MTWDSLCEIMADSEEYGRSGIERWTVSAQEEAECVRNNIRSLEKSCEDYEWEVVALLNQISSLRSRIKSMKIAHEDLQEDRDEWMDSAIAWKKCAVGYEE